MGYLLKQALKVLCAANHWSYAVFWKLGCHNPKLLIWEECYHGSLQNPNVAHSPSMGNKGVTLQKLEGYNGAQVGVPVHLLIDKMMMSNQIHMVGEGLVGRAAFTGNHHWIVSGNFNENAHPAEVLNEIRVQFSTGMQTIAVIPVMPHGVVQLASPLSIMENVGFVHDVKSLILQVGCVPGMFMSDSYMTKNGSSMYGLPVVDVTSIPLDLDGSQTQMDSSFAVAERFDRPKSSSQTLGHGNHSSNTLLSQFQGNLQVGGSTFAMPNLTLESCKYLEDLRTANIAATGGFSVDPPNVLLDNIANGGIVVPPKPDSLIRQPACLGNPVSMGNYPRPSASCRSFIMSKQPTSVNGGVTGVPDGNLTTLSVSNSISAPLLNTNKRFHSTVEGCHSNVMSGSSELAGGMSGQHDHPSRKSSDANMTFLEADSSIKELVGLLNTDHQLSSNSISGLPIVDNCTRDSRHTPQHILAKAYDDDPLDVLKAHPELLEHKSSGNFCPDEPSIGNQVSSSKNPVPENVFFEASARDDLFDILGVDFKNKLLNGNDSELENRFGAGTKDQIKNLPRSMNMQNLSSVVCSDHYEGISENGIFYSSGSDHLLDAVISGVSSASRQVSDDYMSCRSTVSKNSNTSAPSIPHSSHALSDVIKVSDQMQGPPFGPSNPIMRLGEPIGSAIRSACGKSDAGNCSLTSSYGSQISSWIEQGPSVSISTANSKKPDEASKTNRTRLKPGDNPRPRPKDRQMIQDRVKELREIVPNGGKCSIDALLERTIKHMLFLQSVTKHADKLKQTVETKITKREGGMPLKDNFEGGATWAFELGSQSMVCPIVVEDLNPPRQMLIELLCEERGFFLEIADIIRGMGLTILKGVMETRKDKIWARFAVEANRDVTRMEVFISLVHLLEQTLNGSAASVNGAATDNGKVHPGSMVANEQLAGPIVCGEPSAI